MQSSVRLIQEFYIHRFDCREGLIGILLAVFAVWGVNTDLGLNIGQLGGLIVFALLAFTLLGQSLYNTSVRR